MHNEKIIETYSNYKNKLDLIYEKVTQGIRVRNKCNWYEEGEKPTKFFLKLEKKKGVNGLVKNLITDGKEVNEQAGINKEIKNFFETLFKKMFKTPI